MLARSSRLDQTLRRRTTALLVAPILLMGLTADATVVLTSGARLVKDINQGHLRGLRLDATPKDTNVGGTLFFEARDGVRGRELWKNDGSRAGTVLVKDINPTRGSSPYELTDVGGTLYFSANDGAHGRELWKSDGTRAGTVLVKDINPIGAPRLAS